MSVKEPTSLIMSGVESESYFEIAMSVGIRKVLMSFLYIQRKGKKFLRERLEKYPDVKIMVDSGAFTFLTKDEYSNKPIDYWEKYLDKYTKFIKENKEHIFSCVELDIQDLVGEELVNEWREKYFAPLEKEGILVCYVWHKDDGISKWKEMCQRFNYVGFSLETGDFTEIEMIKMINTAKQYNTIIHGFALTKIDTMTKIPFFSVDSTTWLVGTKYGELNWFDGRKWTRLKKDKWKRQYKTKFIKLGANWELLEKENPYELIRVNLLVFQEAEKYIRKRLTAKMYWLKGTDSMPKLKKVKPASESVVDVEVISAVDVVEKPKKRLSIKKGVPEREDLKGKTKYEEFMEVSTPKTIEDIEFPDLDWFNGNCEEYEEFLSAFNVETINTKDEALDLIWAFTVFIKYTDEINDETSELFLNDDVIDIEYSVYYEDEVEREIKIERIKQIYIDNILGARSDFKLEQEIPIAKERTDYYEPEEYELEDLSEEDISNMLPAMPEVDEYDEELNNYGIDVIRDSKGRFIKGQRLVRKPKNIYSDKFPKLVCDTCYKAGDCPEYKEGYVCKFHKLFTQFDTRDTEDVLEAMQTMVNFNIGRMQRMMMFEIMDGGMADQAVSALIDQNIRLLNGIKELSRFNLIAQQRKTYNADGTVVIENEVRTNPEKGSILERLFMNASNEEEE